MLWFLIGFGAAQLFQLPLTAQRAAPGQFLMPGGAAARPAVQSLASAPPRLVVRPCAEEASGRWALGASAGRDEFLFKFVVFSV